ncbi:transcriptional regulator [Lysinibacillus sp. KCTC 33748]|uniref:helix-turn-helix domain-containing protein n=1 Tax=unclassified Lysinibacillus TaxID=2636778 RepID=UPI0009A642C8|nr:MULTISPECIES: helix-turn-helix transcriptional regulator [unclassified Lysinibacillus]OXS70204.1 transcriptional regulator [Lysinibacillus sp. KCTC 33748]SKC04606.1 Helix-turn-helix [Lysinibacillus sp. AC-3]
MKIFNLEYVKQRRQKLNLTLQEVADEMGMKNASTYLKYENGTYAFKAEQLPLLANTLKCNTENFFIEKIAKIAIS